MCYNHCTRWANAAVWSCASHNCVPIDRERYSNTMISLHRIGCVTSGRVGSIHSVDKDTVHMIACVRGEGEPLVVAIVHTQVPLWTNAAIRPGTRYNGVHVDCELRADRVVHRYIRECKTNCRVGFVYSVDKNAVHMIACARGEGES